VPGWTQALSRVPHAGGSRLWAEHHSALPPSALEMLPLPGTPAVLVRAAIARKRRHRQRVTMESMIQELRGAAVLAPLAMPAPHWSVEGCVPAWALAQLCKGPKPPPEGR